MTHDEDYYKQLLIERIVLRFSIVYYASLRTRHSARTVLLCDRFICCIGIELRFFWISRVAALTYIVIPMLSVNALTFIM
jgi:hypothetical protein